jgi:hypothetical protein
MLRGDLVGAGRGDATMLRLSCLCGRTHLTVESRPDYINECNCTLCRKSGARWGYYRPSEVTVAGATRGYSREDKPDAAVEVHFCPTCGSTTHWVLNERGVSKFGNVRMGVNMGLAEEHELAGVELRFPDGQAWSGEGDHGYVREPRVLG